MVTDPQGATPRTDAGSNLLRPAFSFKQGVSMPGAGGAAASGHAALLDLSSVASWRLVYTGLAVAYIVGFHASLGRIGVRVGGSAHGKPQAQLALVASYLIVLHFAVNTVAGGFPNVTAIRALQQSITQ